MRSGAMTVEQMLIILVAMIAPLVWAFTHHGRTRMITLMLWIPFWPFVARIVNTPEYPPSARLNWAVSGLLTNPLTLVWPLFVLIVYGIIRLFTLRRVLLSREWWQHVLASGRLETHAQARNHARAAALPPISNASSGIPAQPVVPSHSLPPPWKAENSMQPEPLKRCFECNRRVPMSATSCPYCQHGFGAIRALEKPEQSVEAEEPGPQPNGQNSSGGAKPPTAVVEQIRLIGELLDDGLLTEEEFQTKKMELLSRI